jgi:hypothetical protein
VVLVWRRCVAVLFHFVAKSLFGIRRLRVHTLPMTVWFSLCQPRVNGVQPQARNAQTVTVVGSKLFLFGGHSGNKHLRDMHILDTETMTWSQVGHIVNAVKIVC